jgi:hypothetical protein
MFFTFAAILVLFTPVTPPPGEKLSDSMYFNLIGCSATANSYYDPQVILAAAITQHSFSLMDERVDRKPGSQLSEVSFHQRFITDGNDATRRMFFRLKYTRWRRSG